MRDHASPVQSVQKDYCAANVSNVRQTGTARNVGALLSLTCHTYTHAHTLGAHCRESYHCTSAQVDPPKQVDIFICSKKNCMQLLGNHPRPQQEHQTRCRKFAISEGLPPCEPWIAAVALSGPSAVEE